LSFGRSTIAEYLERSLGKVIIKIHLFDFGQLLSLV
jgi:hypothetical protein